MNRFYSINGVSFVLHRVTGVLLVVYLLAHLFSIGTAAMFGADVFDATMELLASDYFVFGEVIVIGCIAFHGLNGLRVIASERGIGLGNSKSWAWGVASGTCAVWALLTAYLIIF